ncbi:histidinol dehydrogenase, partial [Klebsiella oxytoca]
MRIVKLTDDTRQNLLESLLKRSTNDYGDYEKVVADIIENVKNRKEDAIFEYSLIFDKCVMTKETFQITRAEID